ncbi:SDR family NAD(P)-dependent oxidoreductase [Arthrobacter sp. UM1]|uniref:SDR family NAD(P)-dependent oxidoreductase n=1 Tax=Arthrobacter sp. UM1 TaxID=2766776 RepID=UPI001CF683B0|nr:SDR family oxidoreductase [Arthrobacter sp. UM1]MCB4207415.1 SDR family oxidoreductase [Arthrobacter sp. UM1]
MTEIPATVLITGASSGIGEEFARRFAAMHADLILVARRAEKLEALATELSSGHGVTATPVTADLTEPGAASRLHEEIRSRGLRVDALVNNAGFGRQIRFSEQDPDDAARMAQLNVAALTELTREFLPEFAQTKGGFLINLASVAAYEPIPYMAVYGATKAYVLSFTEALWAEHRKDPVKILAVSPGPTETEFFDVAGHAADAGLPRSTAASVVDSAIRTLGRRNPPPSVVSGAGNKAAAFVPRLFSRRFVAWGMAEGLERQRGAGR